MQANQPPNPLIKQIDVPITDPAFYPRLYQLFANTPTTDPLTNAITESYQELSERLDQTLIQESCSVRNNLISRTLATIFINVEGDLQLHYLSEAEALLQQNLFDLGPGREPDGRRYLHILNVVQSLLAQKDLRQQLRLITRPYGHRLGEQIIRDTLQLDATTTLTDAHARQAVLAAWLCFLRQNVGSCFATAPAILIHDEQPLQFLKDMFEILSTGRLKRTFGGVEYSVPISFTWGAGDLRKQFVISQTNYDGVPIWKSPGFLAALTSSGVVSNPLAFDEAQTAVSSSLPQISMPTSVEQILKTILLNHFHITEQEIKDYENRPRPMLQSNMLVQATASNQPASGSKTQTYDRFQSAFERACNTFKALKDNALLKTWEFTLASFAETKSDFAKWNLYSSLGLGPEEPGGIGERLYHIIAQKLERANQKVHEFQQEYEQLYSQVKYLEGRLQRASTEQEIKWLRVEYDAKVNEFRTFEDIRNAHHETAKRYANLFNTLVDAYLQLFPQYFQEVYDANLQEVDVGPYDDSPAGFRLVYKHGRTNTALWQPIRNHVEFIDALASFFALSESQLTNSEELQGLERDLSEIVTDIVVHVKTPEFLESAFYRMAVAHKGRPIKDPLQHLELIEKKPWAYTSGGTMDTLVSNYFKREDKPTTASRWVENETELLVFLLDTIKQLPAKDLDKCLNNSTPSLLMHSPTHAFILKPTLKWFKEGVIDSTYTYIWVRDTLINPSQKFVENLSLDRETMEQLIEQLLTSIPSLQRAQTQDLFKSVPGRMKVKEFREYALQRTHRILNKTQVDTILYACLPATHGYQIRQRVIKILEQLPGMTTHRLKNLTNLYDSYQPVSNPRTLLAFQLRNVVKSLLILEGGLVRSPYDVHQQVTAAMQQLEFSMPEPLLFADTNWATNYFGFVSNPGTGHYELWQLDYTGSSGSAMTHWKQWLDGSRRDIPWAVYNRPQEYQS